VKTDYYLILIWLNHKKPKSRDIMAITTIGNNFLYLLEDIKTKDHNSKEAYYNKANQHLSENEFDQAKQSYNRALQIDPDFDIALSNRAVAEIYTGEYGNAIATYLKMFDILKKGQINIKYNIALNNLGVAFILSGKHNEAIKIFDELISLNDEDELAHLHRGNAMLELKNYDEALKSFDKVTSINDKNVLAFFIKGNLHFWREEYDQAIQAYNRSIEINPGFTEAYRNKAKSLSSVKKYEEAFKCLDQAIEQSPENTDLLLDKANIYLLLERFNEAEEHYNQLIQIDPQNKNAMNYKVVALFKQGKYEQTLQTIEDILKLDPNDKDAIDRKNLIESLLEKQKSGQVDVNQEMDHTNKGKTQSKEGVTEESLSIEQAKNKYGNHWIAFQKDNINEFGDDTMGNVIIADRDYKSFTKKVDKASVKGLYCFYAGNGH